jgi:anti-anti-sigma factor
MFQFQNTATEFRIVIEVKNFEATNVEEFRTALNREFPAEHGEIVVDLSQVEMIDSSAIGALLSIQKRLAGTDQRVILVGAKPAVLSVIELLRLHRVFRIDLAEVAA